LRRKLCRILADSFLLRRKYALKLRPNILAIHLLGLASTCFSYVRVFYRSSRSFPIRSNLGFIRRRRGAVATLADSVLFIGKSLGSISSRSFESMLVLRYVHFSLDRNLLGKRSYDCHLFW